MCDQYRLAQLVKDARRFIMYHKEAIQGYPLQTYASALLFSPADSLVRRLYQQEAPEEVCIRPMLSNSWSACLQTLEGHSSWVYSVAFSHDSTRLASASWDSTVKIWDVSSGECLRTLEGHSDYVNSVAFSHDSTRLASASSDNTLKLRDHDSTVKIWDAGSGACLQTLEGYSSIVSSANLVSILALLNTTETVRKHERGVSQGAAIGSDDIWISNNSQNLLWLPTEYRPACSAALGRCVGIGTGSGKVWFCRFL
jgi:WD40 repeat protein